MACSNGDGFGTGSVVPSRMDSASGQNGANYWRTTWWACHRCAGWQAGEQPLQPVLTYCILSPCCRNADGTVKDYQSLAVLSYLDPEHGFAYHRTITKPIFYWIKANKV